MFNVALGAILFVCSGYVGYAVGAHYRKRSNLFVGITAYVDSLEKGMSFLQSTLGELTENFVSDKKDDLARILNAYLSLLKSGSVSKEDCKNATKTRLLNGYEQGLLAEMLFSLGKSDLDTQLAELARYKALFAPITETARQNYKKYGALSFKLGILAGLAAMLLAA